MKKKNKDLELHFRMQLTHESWVSDLEDCLPELKDAILEYKEDDPEIKLQFMFVSEVFNPVLYSYLDSAEQDLNLGKRLFHFLELMARSRDEELWNLQAVGILSKLNPRQLEIVEKYMGPSTKRNLVNYQNYRKQI